MSLAIRLVPETLAHWPLGLSVQATLLWGQRLRIRVQYSSCRMPPTQDLYGRLMVFMIISISRRVDLFYWILRPTRPFLREHLSAKEPKYTSSIAVVLLRPVRSMYQ